MATVKMLMVLVVIIMAAASSNLGGKYYWAEAQLHHVVGGDQGWDPSSDVASWSSGRSFRVGDKLWFAYSASQDKVVELMSKEEYESCDVSNPIRMYTDGINGIPLDLEGIRYFVSSKPESCKSGLKLHVEVMPLDSAKPKVTVSEADNSVVSDLAVAPSTPSGSVQLCKSFVLLFIGLWVYFLAL